MGMGSIGDAYRRVRALISERPSGFSWVDDDVAASGRPMSEGQLRWIKDKGISVVISLTELPLPEEWLKNLEIKYFHFPIRDHSAPDPEILKQVVEKILEEIKLGEKILIHCAAGLGRTGTVLAAYFIARKGLPAEEAISLVRKLRPRSIEPIQERSIQDFYRRYG